MISANGDFGLRGKGKAAESEREIPNLLAWARREYRRDCHLDKVLRYEIL